MIGYCDKYLCFALNFVTRVISVNRLFLFFAILLLLSVFSMISPLSVKYSFENSLLRVYGDSEEGNDQGNGHGGHGMGSPR
jgi:hypothetical protein